VTRLEVLCQIGQSVPKPADAISSLLINGHFYGLLIISIMSHGKIISAAFSPRAYKQVCMGHDMGLGMTLASTTVSPLTPITQKSVSTNLPIAAVPAGC
jgi:hypothetical protein